MTTDSFYGVDLDAAAGSGPAATDDMLKVFDFLRPKRQELPLIRIGGNHDGAYLVPNDLDGIAACFSPGVNRIKYFEDVLGDTYGIKAHMCDFTCDVSEFTTPLREGMQTFSKKWLDAAPGEDNISLEAWVEENSGPGDLLLQMDIEGAEFRNILAASDDLLARFRIVVLEVHGLGQMTRAAELGSAIAPFFATLARSFTTVHAHPNNCCGEFTIPGTDIAVPNVLELTLLRNDRFVTAPGAPSLPHPLDIARNVPGNPPLFLSEAWCGDARPLESRVKVLEDTLAHRQAVDAVAEDELAAVLSLMMQSQQTSDRLRTRARPDVALVEVAHGRPYDLSSAHGSSSRTGTVGPRGNFFFSTALGTNQFIRIDLGGRRRVRRIELVNRRDGLQERARHLFVSLSGGAGSEPTSVFTAVTVGDLPGGGWDTCMVAVPDVEARYVIITAPLHTALHLFDVQVFAIDETAARPAPTRRSGVLRQRNLGRSVRAARRRLTQRAGELLHPAG